VPRGFLNRATRGDQLLPRVRRTPHRPLPVLGSASGSGLGARPRLGRRFLAASHEQVVATRRPRSEECRAWPATPARHIRLTVECGPSLAHWPEVTGHLMASLPHRLIDATSMYHSR
jgi:hypothetical protein